MQNSVAIQSAILEKIRGFLGLIFRIFPNWNDHFRPRLRETGCDVERLYVLQSYRSGTLCKITQKYINYASYCGFIPHKYSIIRKLSFCKVFYKKFGELIHWKLFTNIVIWDASSRYINISKLKIWVFFFLAGSVERLEVLWSVPCWILCIFMYIDINMDIVHL